METGDSVLIGGFILRGDTAKKVIVRAIGPSMAAADGTPLAGTLQDPVLELHGPDGALIAPNDNWKDNQQEAIEESNLAPKDERESAIVATLAPEAYTAVVEGKNSESGIALVEIYDISQDVPTRLANLSTRALVQTKDNVMIGGFIVAGAGGNSNVIVRALGPSLADYGVPGPLSDPLLDIRNKDGTRLTSNDNWQDDANAAKVNEHGLAPAKDVESAIYLDVPPGEYTAVMSGANGESGVGLVEIYHLPSRAASSARPAGE